MGRWKMWKSPQVPSRCRRWLLIIFGGAMCQFLAGCFIIRLNPALVKYAPGSFHGRVFGLSSAAQQFGNMAGSLIAATVIIQSSGRYIFWRESSGLSWDIWRCGWPAPVPCALHPPGRRDSMQRRGSAVLPCTISWKTSPSPAPQPPTWESSCRRRLFSPGS